MRSAWRWILVVAALALAVPVLRATVWRPRPIEVETVQVTRGPVEDLVANSQAGTVRARLRVRLGTESGGTIARLPHREGDRVARGEVLIELDRATGERQLDLARREQQAAAAAVDAADADAALAARERERAEALAARSVLAAEALDQARSRAAGADATRRAARARHAAARAAVRVADDALSHLRVVAPFDGVVSQRFVDVGETVAPAQPALELLGLDSLYVRAPIDETDVARLAPGLAARVTLDTHPGIQWHATVRRVAPYVDDTREQNRTLDIEVDLPRDPARPIPPPGASADVEVVIGTREHVLRLPAAALLEGDRVYRVAGGRAVLHPVEAGLRNWDWVEIQSGLAEGDHVVVTLDRAGLADGAALRVRERAPVDTARVTRR